MCGELSVRTRRQKQPGEPCSMPVYPSTQPPPRLTCPLAVPRQGRRPTGKGPRAGAPVPCGTTPPFCMMWTYVSYTLRAHRTLTILARSASRCLVLKSGEAGFSVTMSPTPSSSAASRERWDESSTPSASWGS